MEGGSEVAEKQSSSSYRYWVRETKSDAAPLPVPHKLAAEEVSNSTPTAAPKLGSVWNQAGTWEEKNLNTWASRRIKELLSSLRSLEFSDGNAVIDEVSKCSGDAFLVTVRNKKRVGYTYELTLKFKGEWLIKEEKRKIKGYLDIPEFSFGELDDLQAFLVTVRNKKRVGYTYELTLKFKGEWLIKEEKRKIKGYLDIPEFSFGELDDLQIELRISEEKDLSAGDKSQIRKDLGAFLAPIREKLLEFEQELKDR